MRAVVAGWSAGVLMILGGCTGEAGTRDVDAWMEAQRKEVKAAALPALPASSPPLGELPRGLASRPDPFHARGQPRPTK